MSASVVPIPVPAAARKRKKPGSPWTCRRCTTTNAAAQLTCTSCTQLKPGTSRAKANEQQQEQHRAKQQKTATLPPSPTPPPPQVQNSSGAVAVDHPNEEKENDRTPCYLLQRYGVVTLEQREKYSVEIRPKDAAGEDQPWGSWRCPVPVCQTTPALGTKNLERAVTTKGKPPTDRPITWIKRASSNILQHMVWHYNRDFCLITTYNMAGNLVGSTEQELVSHGHLGGAVGRYRVPGDRRCTPQQWLLSLAGDTLEPILPADVVDMVLDYLLCIGFHTPPLLMMSFDGYTPSHPAYNDWVCPVRYCAFKTRLYRQQGTDSVWRVLETLNDRIRDHLHDQHPQTVVHTYNEVGAELQ